MRPASSAWTSSANSSTSASWASRFQRNTADRTTEPGDPGGGGNLAVDPRPRHRRCPEHHLHTLIRWPPAQKPNIFQNSGGHSRVIRALEAGSGSDAFAMATRAEDAATISDQRRKRGSPTPPKPGSSALRQRESRRGLQGRHGIHDRTRFPGFKVEKRTSSASGRPRPAS